MISTRYTGVIETDVGDGIADSVPLLKCELSGECVNDSGKNKKRKDCGCSHLQSTKKLCEPKWLSCRGADISYTEGLGRVNVITQVGQHLNYKLPFAKDTRLIGS